jgi:hypothetical protein
MLSKQDDSRRQVAGTARDKTPSHNGGSMIGFILVNGKSHEIDTGQGN